MGAVIDDGNLTGLVGDFGLGFWKALLEVTWLVLLAVAELLVAPSDLVAFFTGLLDPADDLMALESMAFVIFGFDGTVDLDCIGLLTFPGEVGSLVGVVGVLGRTGDFLGFVVGLIVGFLVVVMEAGRADVALGAGLVVPLVCLGFSSTVVDAVTAVAVVSPFVPRRSTLLLRSSTKTLLCTSPFNAGSASP